jgi:Gdp/GTP exchange factor required for growth at low temperatures
VLNRDYQSIVRKLIKVVKDCKEAHTRRGKPPTKQPSNSISKLRSTVNHVLGDKFAEATYKDADSDVDLDFPPDEAGASNTTGGFQSDCANAHLSAVHDGTGLSSIPKPALVPSASAAILQQPLTLNILQQSRALVSASGTPFLQSPTSLPIHHNSPLSRVFVKTIGRLGHWKRVLNSRQAVHPSGTAGVSAFDLELNAEGDLLAVRGGVEQYLKIIEQQPPPPPLVPPDAVAGRGVSHTTTVSEARSSTLVGDNHSDYIGNGSVLQRPMTEASEDIVVENEAVSPPKTFKKSQKRSSSGSSSDSSFGSPIRSKSRPPSVAEPAPQRPPWEFDVVSIDDLDLSDTSSDIHGVTPAPPGLKKQPRKLPLRRDFEFVRQSRESVSSMGITSHQSVVSEASVTSGIEAEKGGGGLFQQWQLNAIIDSLSDNEESGDIDATLRRLEGQINPQKQQEKVSKVDGWVKTIQERMAAGDYTDEAPRFLDDEEGAEDDEPDIDDDTSSAHWSAYNDNEDITGPASSISQGPSSRNSQESVILAAPSASTLTPTTNQNNEVSSKTCTPSSPNRSPGAIPSPEDVLPLEILQGRVPSRPSTSHGPDSKDPVSPPIQPAHFISAMPKFMGNKTHRSWILGYKAQILVEHFSMIDRELFIGVKFEELVLDDWMSCGEVNILDWVQFLKDRARWKAESRSTHKTSALAAVRARFNLVANFTLSEVVLTQPHERPLIVKKFIRIAWVSIVQFLSSVTDILCRKPIASVILTL